MSETDHSNNALATDTGCVRHKSQVRHGCKIRRHARQKGREAGEQQCLRLKETEKENVRESGR